MNVIFQKELKHTINSFSLLIMITIFFDFPNFVGHPETSCTNICFTREYKHVTVVLQPCYKRIYFEYK